MKLVYLAHPFLGKPENVEDAQNIILKLLHKYPDISFYSPLHATGFFYFEISYTKGMEHCFEALSRCDELWLCGNWRDSRGCNMEYGFAKAKGIPIKFIGLTQNENAEVSGKCDRFFIDDGGQCSAPSCWDEDKRDYQIGVKCGGDKIKCCLSDRYI